MAAKIARRRFVQMGAAVLGTAMLPIKARAATPVTLTYLDFVTPNDGSPRGNALARMLKAFADAYPNIKIQIQNVPSTQIPQQLLKAAAAGKSPDVAKVHIPDVSAQVAAGTKSSPWIPTCLGGTGPTGWWIGAAPWSAGRRWPFPGTIAPTSCCTGKGSSRAMGSRCRRRGTKCWPAR